MKQHFRSIAVFCTIALCGALLIPAPSRAADTDEQLPQRIERLICNLGHNDYFERERAQQELLRIGMEAFDDLSAAAGHDDIEIAARAKYLVRLLRVEWSREEDPELVRQLLKDYERLDEPNRLERMNQLLALPADAGLPALCRIVRFEKSLPLSKQAALKIIAQKPRPEIDWNRRQPVIAEALGKSPTVGAAWLRLELQTQRDPAAALPQWNRAIATEESAHARAPQPEIVSTLLRRQVDLLDQLNRQAEAEPVLLKLLEFERGTADSLARLLEYLVERKAWTVIDAAAIRFGMRIDANPFLLYALAEARMKQGKMDVAEEAAQKALEVNGPDQVKHWQLASSLKLRGLHTWAEREYRYGIKVGPANSITTVGLQTELAEMLHDQDNHLAAAQALEGAVAELEKNAELRQTLEQRNREVAGIHSRMLYFYSRHYADNKDAAKHLESLEKAIEKDPTDADVLIALYRLPNQDDARRKKTVDLIRAAAEVFRKQIVGDPDDATAYNQLAWLVGNTEGDQAEALRCSLRSLELVPLAGGYMDTLGRCYYAQGDYEKALYHQTRAVEIDQHSAQMKRQLQLFREALAEQKAEPSKS